MSQYMEPRAYRLGRMTGVNPDLLPALRSLFKERPFSFIIIVFVISVALFSYSFRVAEHHFISQDMMTAYSNMTWMTVITMTTIGFGDISPVTPLGRFVASLCVTWGVIIVAIMVAVLTNTLSLNNQETQSLIILKKLRNKQEVKEAAGLYLRYSLWRVWKNYKHRQRRQ
jgi:voltage-gated potassium channel